VVANGLAECFSVFFPGGSSLICHCLSLHSVVIELVEVGCLFSAVGVDVYLY
jgi:hypothetical protein